MFWGLSNFIVFKGYRVKRRTKAYKGVEKAKEKANTVKIIRLRLLMCVCACATKMAHGHLSRSVSLCADACACRREILRTAIAPCSDSVRKIQFAHTYKSQNSNTP